MGDVFRNLQGFRSMLGPIRHCLTPLSDHFLHFKNKNVTKIKNTKAKFITDSDSGGLVYL